MSKTKVRILLFLVFIFGLSSFVLFKFQDQHPKKIFFKSNTSFGKIYTLSPIFKSDNLNLDDSVIFPRTTISPKSVFYFFANFIEKTNLKNTSFNNFFFAQKRVVELTKWGKELQIMGDIKDTDQLKNWWQKKEPKIWQFYKVKNFSSWEATLARYTLLIEDEIKAIQSSNQEDFYTNLIALKGYIKTNQLNVEAIILSLEKSEEDKNYLISLSGKVFAYLIKKIDDIVPSYDPLRLNYSLQQLIKDKEYGRYVIFIDAIGLPSYLKTASKIKIDGIEINQNEKITDDQSIEFPNVKIDIDSDLITLQLRNIIIPLKGIEWQQAFNENNQIYQYYFIQPTIKENLNYLLNFSYNFKNRVGLMLEKVTIEKNNKNSQAIIDRFLFVRKKTLYQKVVNFGQDQNSYYQFDLISNQSISQKELSQIYIEYQPVIDPEITLEKIDVLPGRIPSIDYKKIKENQYLITVKNSTSAQDKLFSDSLKFWWRIKSKTSFSDGYKVLVEFWPIRVSFFLIFLTFITFLTFVYYLALKKRQRGQVNWIDRILIYVSTLAKKIINVFIKAFVAPFIILKRFLIPQATDKRLIFLSLVFLGLFIDFFITIQSVNLIIYLTIFFWVLVMIGYRIEEKANFMLALGFLILCLFLLILQKGAMAEKFAIWTFMFLLVGTMYSVLSLKYSREKAVLISLNDLPKAIIDDSTLIRFWKPSLNNFFNYIKSFYHRIIQFYRPITFSLNDILRLSTRIVLSLIFIAFFTLTFLNVRQTINRNIGRVRLNPVITKIEPEIVYHSNKIIIRGYNFGWKQYDKVRLMTQYGEAHVGPDLWTNSRIILPVPLHWKIEDIYFWVEKTVGWEGKNIVVKSKVEKIKLISRLDPWEEEDDQYFEQLKHLDSETLKLNGYR